MNNASILLVCSERSGSNLLKAMLNQHPNIYIGPPIPIFECFSPIIDSYGDLDNEDIWLELLNDVSEMLDNNHQPLPVSITTDELSQASGHYVRGWPALLHGTYNALATKMNAPISGYKYSTNMNSLKKLMDETTFTHIIYQVRDPRDVVLSNFKSGFNLGTPSQIAKEWNESQSIALDVLAASSLPSFNMKYEDLISSPQKSMNDLCEFIGLPNFSSAEEFHTDPRNQETAQKSHMWENLNKPLQKENQQKYYQEWNYLSIKLVESEIGSLMSKFGYKKASFFRFTNLFNKPKRRSLDDSDKLFYRDQEIKWAKINKKAATRNEK